MTDTAAVPAITRCDGQCGFVGADPSFNKAHDEFLAFEDRGLDGILGLIVYVECADLNDDELPPICDWPDYVAGHNWNEPGRVRTIVRVLTEWHCQGDALREALTAISMLAATAAAAEAESQRRWAL